MLNTVGTLVMHQLSLYSQMALVLQLAPPHYQVELNQSVNSAGAFVVLPQIIFTQIKAA